MSWFNESRSAFLAALLAVSFSLAGCGFQPLYGTGSAGAVDDELSRVKIEVISDRTGQQAHNFLLDRLNRSGRPEDPQYLLEVKIRIAKTRLGIERDETATRAKLTLTADFSLTDIETKETLVKRTARSTNSYNIVDSAVSTLSAEDDAVERATRQVSEDIRVFLSLYFRRRAAGAGSS